MRELSEIPGETNGALTEIWNDFCHAKKIEKHILDRGRSMYIYREQ